jgi:hypothetical protein
VNIEWCNHIGFNAHDSSRLLEAGRSVTVRPPMTMAVGRNSILLRIRDEQLEPQCHPVAVITKHGGLRLRLNPPYGLDRLIENDAAHRIDAVDLKDVLGQIKANPRDRRKIGDGLSHGRRSF